MYCNLYTVVHKRLQVLVERGEYWSCKRDRDTYIVELIGGYVLHQKVVIHGD